VVLLTASLVLAAVRMAKLEMPMDLNGQMMPDIPLSPLIMLIFAIPGVSLFRRKDSKSNFTFPFTDERGYRSPATVDDGFAVGATIPVLLSAGFLWHTGSLSSQRLWEVGKHGSSGPGDCGLPKAKWPRKQQIPLLKTAS